LHYFLVHQLPQYVRQNPAVLVIINFHRRIYPAARGHRFGLAVCAGDAQGQILLRLQTIAQAENGVRLPGFTLDLPGGTRLVVVGTLMALVLILRPSGLTGGREFSLPRRRA